RDRRFGAVRAGAAHPAPLPGKAARPPLPSRRRPRLRARGPGRGSFHHLAAGGRRRRAQSPPLALRQRGRARAVPEFQRLTYQQATLSDARFLPDARSILAVAVDPNSQARYAPLTARLDPAGAQPFAASFDRLWAVASGEAAVALHLRNVLAYEQEGTLALMPLDGGAPRPLLEHVEFADFAPGGNDPAHLAIARFRPDTQQVTLEYPIGHVLYRTGGWVSEPRFSRDGKLIAFLDHPMAGDDNGQAAVVDMAGHARILGPHWG